MADPSLEKKHHKSVAVVGAGISGLAAAYRLKAEGFSVTVFEAEGVTGGKIRSINEDSLTWEKGANTMTEAEPEISNLIDDLGIRRHQQFPNMPNKRYIVRDGRPQLLPSSPISFFRSPFLTNQAKLRIFLEPLLWKRNLSEKTENINFQQQDESVASFFQRHFGQEVVDYLVDPFVTGTCGGDPESLSIRHSFKEIWELEERFGSIVNGMINSGWTKLKSQQKSGNKKPQQNRQRGSFSFKGGLQTLAESLATRVGHDSINLKSSVSSLQFNPQVSLDQKRWFISYKNYDAFSKENVGKQSFDAVIMTPPLHEFGKMEILKNDKPFPLDFLPKIKYVPISTIVTTFKKQDVRQPLEGFGVLIPSKERQYGFQTLGTLFSSSMFPDRAPSDQYMFTTFIGGTQNMKLASLSSDELQEVVLQDLHKLLGVMSPPVAVKHTYWKEAFPVYDLCYDSAITAMNNIEESLPGLYFAGNYRGGLSVGKTLLSGLKAADQVILSSGFAGINEKRIE